MLKVPLVEVALQLVSDLERCDPSDFGDKTIKRTLGGYGRQIIPADEKIFINRRRIGTLDAAKHGRKHWAWELGDGRGRFSPAKRAKAVRKCENLPNIQKTTAYINFLFDPNESKIRSETWTFESQHLPGLVAETEELREKVSEL